MCKRNQLNTLFIVDVSKFNSHDWSDRWQTDGQTESRQRDKRLETTTYNLQALTVSQPRQQCLSNRTHGFTIARYSVNQHSLIQISSSDLNLYQALRIQLPVKDNITTAPFTIGLQYCSTCSTLYSCRQTSGLDSRSAGASAAHSFVWCTCEVGVVYNVVYVPLPQTANSAVRACGSVDRVIDWHVLLLGSTGTSSTPACD